MFNKFLFYLFISSILLINTVSATVIVDNGQYTTIDDVDWLDLSETGGMTVSEALLSYGSDGWQLATEQQYNQMLSSFISIEDDTLSGVNSPVDWIITTHLYQTTAYESDYLNNTYSQLFGLISTYNWGPFIDNYYQGFYGDENGLFQGGFVISDYGTGKNDVLSIYHDYDWRWCGSGNCFENASSSRNGVYLVRSQVPEPSTIALLGIVILGFGASRRRQFK